MICNNDNNESRCQMPMCRRVCDGTCIDTFDEALTVCRDIGARSVWCIEQAGEQTTEEYSVPQEKYSYYAQWQIQFVTRMLDPDFEWIGLDKQMKMALDLLGTDDAGMILVFLGRLREEQRQYEEQITLYGQAKHVIQNIQQKVVKYVMTLGGRIDTLDDDVRIASFAEQHEMALATLAELENKLSKLSTQEQLRFRSLCNIILKDIMAFLHWDEEQLDYMTSPVAENMMAS